MLSLSVEAICGGCNSSYNACCLSYPLLYYACGPVVLVYNLISHKVETSLHSHKSKINCISHSFPYLITGGTDKKLIIHESLVFVKEIIVPSTVIHISQIPEFSVAICNDGHLSVFSHNFERIQELNFRKNLQETSAICKHFENFYLVTGGADARIHVYVKTLESSLFEYKFSLEGHVRNIRSLSFNLIKNELCLASAGQDSFIRIWKFSSHLDSDDIYSQVYKSGEIQCKLDAVISGHTNLVSSVQWINDCLLSSSHDFSVVLWHEENVSRSWSAKNTFGQMGGNKNIFLGAVGSPGHILAYSYSGGFYYWKEENSKWSPCIAPTGHVNFVTDIAVSNDFIVTSSLDQTCRLWSTQVLSESEAFWLEISRPMVHGYDINSIAVSQNQLISGADEKIIRIFNPSTSTAEILQTQNIFLFAEGRGSSQVLGLTTKLTSDSEIDFKSAVITEDLLNSYTLWPESNKLYGHGYEISVIAVNSTGNILASACKSQNKEHSAVFLWDLQNKQKIQVLEFHTLGVIDICFSNNDQYLLTVSRDRSWCLYFYDEGYKYKCSSQVHTRAIYACDFGKNSQCFATGSRDKKVKIWNLEGEIVENFNFKEPVTALCFLNDFLLAVGFENGMVLILDLHTKEEILAFKHGDCVNKIRTRHDKIYSISNDHTFRVHSFKLNR